MILKKWNLNKNSEVILPIYNLFTHSVLVIQTDDCSHRSLKFEKFLQNAVPGDFILMDETSGVLTDEENQSSTVPVQHDQQKDTSLSKEQNKEFNSDEGTFFENPSAQNEVPLMKTNGLKTNVGKKRRLFWIRMEKENRWSVKIWHKKNASSMKPRCYYNLSGSSVV